VESFFQVLYVVRKYFNLKNPSVWRRAYNVSRSNVVGTDQRLIQISPGEPAEINFLKLKPLSRSQTRGCLTSEWRFPPPCMQVNVHFLTVRDTIDKRAEARRVGVARSAIFHDRYSYRGFPNPATFRDYRIAARQKFMIQICREASYTLVRSIK